ncbi:MAG: alpha/beta fold hydrolase, partial [Chloroflexota bacterium]
MKTLVILLLLSFTAILYSQERFVDVDGQKFRIKEYGKGDLTVIFENGMSDSLETWGNIPDLVSGFARVFLYDRADIGKSDPSRQER